MKTGAGVNSMKSMPSDDVTARRFFCACSAMKPLSIVTARHLSPYVLVSVISVYDESFPPLNATITSYSAFPRFASKTASSFWRRSPRILSNSGAGGAS